jgi:uncharacterized protein YbjT (DUF2867 family)
MGPARQLPRGSAIPEQKDFIMKIVVIGGSGLIGSKLVKTLGARGHEAVAASLASGVNTLTGEGLSGALTGASVVVDVSNSPSFEDAAVLEFFTTSTRNLLAAEAVAGVDITSRCPSWVPSASPEAATSAPSSRRST